MSFELDDLLEGIAEQLERELPGLLVERINEDSQARTYRWLRLTPKRPPSNPYYKPENFDVGLAVNRDGVLISSPSRMAAGMAVNWERYSRFGFQLPPLLEWGEPELERLIRERVRAMLPGLLGE